MNEKISDLGYEEVLVLVDGDCSVILEMSSKCRDEDAPAILLKSRNGISHPLGSCVVEIDESWTLRMASGEPGESYPNFPKIGDFDSRVDAIVQMWRRRREVSLLPQQ